MRKRKPTLQERKVIATSAVKYIAHHVGKGDTATPYQIAFRGLGQIEWLHTQSRDGIAAEAAGCYVKGVVPYAGVSATAKTKSESYWEARRRGQRKQVYRSPSMVFDPRLEK